MVTAEELRAAIRSIETKPEGVYLNDVWQHEGWLGPELAVVKVRYPHLNPKNCDENGYFPEGSEHEHVVWDVACELLRFTAGVDSYIRMADSAPNRLLANWRAQIKTMEAAA